MSTLDATFRIPDDSLVIWKGDVSDARPGVRNVGEGIVFHDYLITPAKLSYGLVTSMTIADDNLFISLEETGIIKVAADNTVSEFVVTDEFREVQILGMTFDSDNNLYVTANANGINGRIYRISPDGKSSSIVAEGFRRPAGVAIRGSYLYVADLGDGKIYKVRIAEASSRAADQPKASDASQLAAKPLTNQDVIDLGKGGSDEASVIRSIKEARAVQFDFSVKGLSNLRNNGISNGVIAAMRTRQAATQRPSLSPRARRKP